MQAVALHQAQLELANLIAHVVSDAEPLIICTDSGEQVVCLSLDEFNSWKGTIYLLGNPVNANRLRKSISEAGLGSSSSHESRAD